MGPGRSRRVWCRDRWLDLSTPVVMGVINVTPDSFSDGGHFLRQATSPDLDAIEQVAQQMIAEGAMLLDVGGESTRPGAAPVDPATELARVIPVMERLARFDTLLSVDTRKAVVARAAIAAGAHFVNDVSAGLDAGMLELVAASGAGLCLMHMQGEPATMQQSPAYADVCAEVCGALLGRVRQAVDAGIREDQLVIDPGIGFGKTPEHNLELIARLEELAATGFPVLVGVSRKSTIGRITGRGVDGRLAGSVAMAVLAAERGARIIRAHDVGPTVDGLAVLEALKRHG